MIRPRIPRRLMAAAVAVVATTMALVGATAPTASAGPPPASLPATGDEPVELAAASAGSLVAGRPAYLRAGPDDAFVQHRIVASRGWRYVPYTRTYRGLPVIGGDFVVVVDPAGRVSSTSVAQNQAIAGLGTKPRLTRAMAEKAAAATLKSVGGIEDSHLVVYALDTAPTLAWESTVDGTGTEGASRLVVDVDATTGAVMHTRDTIVHDSGTGTFNGPNPLSVPSTHYNYVDVTQAVHTKWILGDPTIAGMTCNLDTVYRIDPPTTPVWGFGDATDRETACVDATFAMETQVQMLSRWLGRHGMDGDGDAFPVVVGFNEHNARYFHWAFGARVDIGYDDLNRWVSTLDIVGHEEGHGIDDNTPGGMSGGGTSEFIADAFGAATEWYANESAPYDTPDFMNGDRVSGFLRSMFRPSSTGGADCYSSTVPTMEVHAAAGVGDHWFYLLSEGTNPTDGQPASPTCNSTTLTGVGIQKAMQILYNAMLMKTSSSSYQTYRLWTLTATKNLFPSDCALLAKVRAAWDAVNVPAQPGEPAVCVPNVVGSSQGIATVTITGSDLALGTVSQQASLYPVGTVIGQNPSAGTIVPAGAPVNITVSIGGVSIPSLYGLSHTNASSLLTSMGLVPAASAEFDCIDPGDVIAQDPAGTVVAPGSTVNFTWDSGTLKSCGIIR